MMKIKKIKQNSTKRGLRFLNLLLEFIVALFKFLYYYKLICFGSINKAPSGFIPCKKDQLLSLH
ncbi:hypothetical protein CRI87_08255 [Liquorilactobacillus satsumensis]|nr:hypothetical protein [Liquorilactobacillus satsumensis]